MHITNILCFFIFTMSEWAVVPSPLDRYFPIKRYYVNENGNDDSTRSFPFDPYCHEHSNGICLIGIAAVKESFTVIWGRDAQALFDIGFELSKSKKGAPVLTAGDEICKLKIEDEIFSVEMPSFEKLQTCTLVEVNENPFGPDECERWLAVVVLPKGAGPNVKKRKVISTEWTQLTQKEYFARHH